MLLYSADNSDRTRVLTQRHSPRQRCEETPFTQQHSPGPETARPHTVAVRRAARGVPREGERRASSRACTRSLAHRGVLAPVGPLPAKVQEAERAAQEGEGQGAQGGGAHPRFPAPPRSLLGASSLQARKEREYTPFPPAPTPRKVDLQLESGEYFLSDEQKRARKQEARDQKQAEASAASAAKRQARFVAPKEAAARPAAAKRKPAEERSAADLAATLRGKDAAGKKRRVRGGQGV